MRPFIHQSFSREASAQKRSMVSRSWLGIPPDGVEIGLPDAADGAAFYPPELSREASWRGRGRAGEAELLLDLGDDAIFLVRCSFCRMSLGFGKV